MKLLVTGGSGLVGRHVVDELSRTMDVTNLDIAPPKRKDTKFIAADVLDLPGLKEKTSGFDAVVHLAGIPHPLTEPAEKVFRVNVMGTFNMLEAAVHNGVRKFIFMSSESTLGFAFSSSRMWPDYIPIDENHSIRPQDPYGLSKVLCEALCAGYTRRSGLRTVCLRSPWIWVPEPQERERYRKLVSEYQEWSKNLWAYIHVADVAQAISRALDASLSENHEIFFICANENWTDVDSRELVRNYYPEIQRISEHFADRQSLISNEKAKRLLGFRPRFERNNIFGVQIADSQR